MEKKYEDDELAKLTDEELDALINEQYVKEAQIMEEALFSDGKYEDYKASEKEIKASYQQLVKRMESEKREDGENMGRSFTDIPDTTEKVVSISQTSIPKKTKTVVSYRFAKVAGYVLVAGMCVFAASMTSKADRNYFADSIKILSGDDTRVVADNDKTYEGVHIEEYNAIKNIEGQLGVDIPYFLYRPEGFEIYKYEVDLYAQFAKIEYQYNGTIIDLQINKEDEVAASDSAASDASIHGDVLETVDMESENIKVSISKIQDEQDQLPSYIAQWEREDAIYYICGKVDQMELEKMIEEMRYEL